MPTVRDEQLQGFVHCQDPFCAGNKQREVPVVRTSSDYTFFELGGAGSVPGIERTSIHLRCEDDQDTVCRTCKGPCEVSDQKRPVYPVTRRDWAQDGLLQLIRDGLVRPPGETGPVEQDDKVAELERKLARLEALLEDKPEKRGPGRPRKEPTIEGDE